MKPLYSNSQLFVKQNYASNQYSYICMKAKIMSFTSMHDKDNSLPVEQNQNMRI